MNSSQNQSKAWRYFKKQNNGQTVTCKLSTKKNTSTIEEYEYDDENDDSEGVEYYDSREHNGDTFGNDLAQIMKH
ncbi:Protein CBG21958 [Caenorhabditis briggsae]|uniref:Protein CBG21958 n=1 Tax=Caenorhabditis briggsae TaxID=6238 RepID=A8Y149_CAEBR|nr:Protein CBG21958 [Caenorhabditis briggsae]CAP38610.1 Protein CBG21958 [Caenorhabditis briggsae]